MLDCRQIVTVHPPQPQNLLYSAEISFIEVPVPAIGSCRGQQAIALPGAQCRNLHAGELAHVADREWFPFHLHGDLQNEARICDQQIICRFLDHINWDFMLQEQGLVFLR